MQVQTRFGYPAHTCMWTRYLLLLVSFAAQIFFSQATLVASEIYDWETKYSVDYSVYTRMWMPDDLETVKGILIAGNCAGSDNRNAVYQERYRLFAELHDFAVIGTAYWGNISEYDITMWEENLSGLASQSGHPELVNAPWAPVGLSMGGQMSYGFNVQRPEKVLACIANKGRYYCDYLPDQPSLKTPAILIAGELDSEACRTSIRGLFDDNRPRGALWAWVEEPDIGHAGMAERLVLPLMDQAIKLRYPDDQLPTATSGVTLKDLNETDGWLADQSTWHSQMTEISPFSEYTGDPENAGWLMNEGMANLYRAFSTYDKDVSLEPSPDVLCGYVKDTPYFSIGVDTSEVPDWSKVELFDYDQCIQTVFSLGTPSDYVHIITPTMLPGVHGLFALVTHADGVTVSTTDAVAYILVPEPSAVVMLVWGGLGLGLFGLLRRMMVKG